MKKWYLIPLLLWFPTYQIYLIYDHHQYPLWVALVGSLIDILSEWVLLQAYYNYKSSKSLNFLLNGILFLWYLYYFTVDITGVNGNLFWTCIFSAIDLGMIMLSLDNLIADIFKKKTVSYYERFTTITLKYRIPIYIYNLLK